jgi:uncharacterized protein
VGKILKVAVVGAGVTGLVAAWLLGTRYEVTLYEADDRLGGHSNTIDVDTPEGHCPIDTGFIVYNTASYPNLIALFDRLRVPTANTDMGFAVSLGGGAYEYAGTGLRGLIGQPSNLVSPAHWRLMREIFRFFREASTAEAASTDPSVTLEAWLKQRKYSKEFIYAHIVPMGAAIWSTPAEDMLGFPFAAFARFFANHGLLQTFKRPPWRTVRGGSREYVTRLMADYKGRTVKGDAVVSVAGGPGSVTITTAGGQSEIHDAALVCCHADDALRITDPPDPASRALLAKFRYSDNTAVLHTDAQQMPRRRALWAAWNYIGSVSERGGQIADRLSVSYWMNTLQPLPVKTDYFVTLNPATPIDPSKIVRTFAYRHPMFDAGALSAQPKLLSLQGRNSIWYAGSYFGYGFHEDGVQAGLAAAEDLSARLAGSSVGEGGALKRPWAWDTRKSRIATAYEPPPELVEAAQ